MSAVIAAALLLAALPAFGEPALCQDWDREDAFTGKKTIVLLCGTPDADQFQSLTIFCAPATRKYAILLKLSDHYMESEGNRIDVEYSIDKGRVHDVGGSTVMGDRQAIDKETASRILGNLTGAHTLAFRSRLRGHGRVSAVFDLRDPKRKINSFKSFHVSFARIMSACSPEADQ